MVAGVALRDFWTLTPGELAMTCRAFWRRTRAQLGLPDADDEDDDIDDSAGVFARLSAVAERQAREKAVPCLPG